PRWAVEQSFDLDFHLRRTRLPQPGTTRQLLEALQPMATTSFDRARPLWEFMLFEGLQGPDGERAALAMKVHHSVTDGVGGMELPTPRLDLGRDPPFPTDDALPAAPAPESFSSMALLRDSAAHTRRRVLGIASRVPGQVMRTGVNAVLHPFATTAALS